MNIKQWLNEDKGGFGAFLIFVIVGLMFYALHRKEPVAVEEIPPPETEKVTTPKQVVARKPLTNPIPQIWVRTTVPNRKQAIVL